MSTSEKMTWQKIKVHIPNFAKIDSLVGLQKCAQIDKIIFLQQPLFLGPSKYFLYTNI